MFCSFGQAHQTCLVHACVPHLLDIASCLRTRLFSILKIANEDQEALVNIAGIGEIETKETPSRKGKQRKGKATKSIVTKCMQVQKASVSREKRHESFASFAVT